MKYKFLAYQAIQTWVLAENGRYKYDHERSQSLTALVNADMAANGYIPAQPGAINYSEVHGMRTPDSFTVIASVGILVILPGTVENNGHTEIPPAVDALAASLVHQGFKVQVNPAGVE